MVIMHLAPPSCPVLRSQEEIAVNWLIIRQVGIIAALAIVALILWIDVTTNLWQDYVILSGLAAGIVTFVLTALIIDRVIARSTHERWAPVTRLAMSDILHVLADDDASEITHGKIVPRQLGLINAESSMPVEEQIAQIRQDVLDERRKLAATLAAWSNFLASSADATEVLDHTAEIAERLDLVRDAAVRASRGQLDDHIPELNHEISLFNTSSRSLITELMDQIDATNTISRLTVYREQLMGAVAEPGGHDGSAETTRKAND